MTHPQPRPEEELPEFCDRPGSDTDRADARPVRYTTADIAAHFALLADLVRRPDGTAP